MSWVTGSLTNFASPTRHDRSAASGAAFRRRAGLLPAQPSFLSIQCPLPAPLPSRVDRRGELRPGIACDDLVRFHPLRHTRAYHFFALAATPAEPTCDHR